MHTMMKSALFSSLVLLTACEGKWEKLADEQLAAKAGECSSIGDPSSAMIQVCKNVTRECERRREKGVYVC